MNNELIVSDLGKSCCNRIDQYVMSGMLSNDDLVQIIEVCGSFLNLQTIPDYAKSHNISYNGAKNHRKNVTLFGVRFIVDND